MKLPDIAQRKRAVEERTSDKDIRGKGMITSRKLMIIEAIACNLVMLILGITIGLILSYFVWTTEATKYSEAKHDFNYCPYCGELLEVENDTNRRR